MRTLIQFTNKLRKQFPAKLPIKVRTIKMPYCNKKENQRFFGDANEYDTHFLIRINKESELSIQKDTLLHEWAHCVAGWDNDTDSHTEEWGICYSNIYREMVGD